MTTAEEQLKILVSGVNQTHSEEALLEKIKKGKKLRVKLGFDPSSPDLHLGHVVVMDKIRQFQEFGHLAVIIIGDYTAMIGDPTGRSKTRPALETTEVKENAKTYTDQVFKVLKKDQTEIRYNSEWFDKFGYADVLKLNAQMTVAQLLEREDFRNRYENKQSITLTEFQYPLMQGYDSVMVESDLELGGNDQLFNNLVGRDLQKANGQEPQVVMVLPILTGTDGEKKMSKSLQNAVGILDAPHDMFGKVMSISDETMTEWRKMLGNAYGLPEQAPEHPMEVKKELAVSIVARFHGAEAGAQARTDFETKFSKKDLNAANLEEHQISENPIWISKLLQEAGAVKSSSDARRLVQQGAVKIEGEKVTDFKANIEVKGGEVLQSGKKFFRKLVA
ncbi:MAG: tyrosine--tRNA ligase [Verrucomicrobiota bacterium]